MLAKSCETHFFPPVLKNGMKLVAFFFSKRCVTMIVDYKSKSLICCFLATVVGCFFVFRRKNMKRKFSGIALVTGANGGIGVELSLELARRGCSLILVGRNSQTLEATKQQCIDSGARAVTTIAVDITHDDSATIILQHLTSKHNGHLDLLVLNAGRGAIAPFDSSSKSMDMCREMMEINYFANVRLLQAFLQPLNSSCGTVVAISSLAGVLPSTLRAAYTASKHAFQGFCNAVRSEYSHVHFTVCCPGFVETPFHKRVMVNSGIAPERNSNSHSMTAKRCAQMCIEAGELQAMELIMTWQGWLAYCLRPLFPGFIDNMAKKKALATLKH